MTDAELVALKARAEAGEPRAQMAFAQALDARGDHDAALQVLDRAARGGFPLAQHVLGARLMVGRAAPYLPQEGVKLISAAAHGGLADAQRMMASIAAMSGQMKDAVLHLQQAAKSGDALARAQLSLVAPRGEIDAGFWTGKAEVEERVASPRIGVIRNFISRQVCEWLVAMARPKLEAVRIRDPRGGARQDEYRSNSGMGFGFLDTSLVLQLVQVRIAATIGVPLNHQEPTNILHYAPGEEYRPHYDFVDPNIAANLDELSKAGQRTVTFLIYLNDDFEGGETEFPRLDFRFRGAPGDALVFWNVAPDGTPEKSSLHAGLAPTRGEKWLFSKWVRANPLPLI